MKKILLITLIVSSIVLFNQEAKADFSGGLKIGFNASKVTGSSPIIGKYGFAPGAHIGAYFRVGIKEKYRIQAEVLFSTKGSTRDLPTGLFETEKYYDLPFYIDVPIMFNYKPVAGLFIEAGVQPSFAVSGIQFSANTETTTGTGGIKTFDFAPVVGLGYEFDKISIGLRSSFGLTNTNDGLFAAAAVQKNLTLMLSFGFKF